MDKITTEREFKNPEETLEWKQVAELPQGVSEAILYRDEKTGTYARMLRYEPGFKGTDEPLCHDFDEVVYIVSGAAYNKRLDKTYEAGSVAVFPAGLKHGPLASPGGGLLIEFRYYKK